jgi:hypothetical protein
MPCSHSLLAAYHTRDDHDLLDRRIELFDARRSQILLNFESCGAPGSLCGKYALGLANRR